MNEQKNTRASKRTRGRHKWVLPVCIAAAAAAAILILVLIAIPGGPGKGLKMDANAQVGNLPGKTQEEIQEELNRIVEEGMFNISIAAVIYFPDGGADGTANIENIAANRCLMTVAITLDDTGETVYESDGIKPGEYIETIRLSKTLPEGEHAATALFTAYDPETSEPVGQAGAQIRLVAEN